MRDAFRTGDVGLLAPAWAGSAAARLLDDTAVLQAMLDVEHAWVQVCLGAGLGHASAGAAEAWQAQRYDLGSIAARVAEGGNPLIPLLADLRSALGDQGAEAAVVHLGATSQDVLDSALMLLAARLIDDALPRLDAACDALAGLADAHRGTLCVARSLGQHALPYTLGLRAARWLDGLSHATADLRVARAGLPLQWVGAAGTGAALTAHLRRAGADASPATLRVELAERLGLLDAPGWHTNRLPITRLAGALTGVLAAAGTIATDVVTGSRNEIGELAEPAGPAGRGGSSAMPHKRNPVLSVTIRSAALGAPGLLGTITTAAGLAADERPDGAWHAEWSPLRELLRLTGGVAQTLAELCAGLRVDDDALLRNLYASTPQVLAEWAGIAGADPAELSPGDYLGESDEFIDRILFAHSARLG